MTFKNWWDQKSYENKTWTIFKLYLTIWWIILIVLSWDSYPFGSLGIILLGGAVITIYFIAKVIFKGISFLFNSIEKNTTTKEKKENTSDKNNKKNSFYLWGGLIGLIIAVLNFFSYLPESGNAQEYDWGYILSNSVASLFTLVPLGILIGWIIGKIKFSNE